MISKIIKPIKYAFFPLLLIGILLFIVVFSNANNDKVSAADENRRIGCWWWHYADGANASKRAQYLKFLDEHGVTEIYYYAYNELAGSSGRSEIHEFVSEANELGMRVSILYEYADGVMNGASNTFNKLLGYYNSYKSTYPNDDLYGFHFDIEPGVSTSIFTRYCNNFINYLYILRDGGCEVEVDVGCGWGSYGETIELNGVKGIYNIIAANVDTMTLMSYRDTARQIVSMGYDPLNACKAQGCACLFGVETDNANEGDQVDFSGESVQYLMEEMDKVFDLLAEKDLSIEYGMAIHHARSFNNLRLTEPVTEPMRKVNLYSAKELDLHYSGQHAVIYTDPALVEAIHNDYNEYGPIDDTESYYKITISCKTGSTNYVYPCMWDATNEFDLWPGGLSDYPSGTTTGAGLKNISSFVRTINYPKQSKMGEFTSDEDGIYIYLETIDSITITAVTLEVYHPERLFPVSSVEESDISSSDKLGDVNGDFNIDLKDVLELRKYIAQMAVKIDLDLSDVNLDSSVDLKDVLELRKFIAKMPSSLDIVY